MTSLLEGAKKLVTRSSDVGARVDGLERAAAGARGRVDDAIVDDAAAVAARAASRLRLSADHTVVALAGATGSGKSSTFNALSGLELSAVGVRRPTTSWATACVWGKEGAEELLEWLGIPARHQVTRDSMLSAADEDAELRGVVLLDLPDHDSTEVSHHLEVDRLVQLADMLVWVLDPQKYADAAIHERFLRPLAGHRDVMLVVLNHIDTVPENRRASMVEDVRRLLEADGLAGVPVLPVSARHGWGVDELRGMVAKRVAEKKVTRSRLEADVRAAAERLQEATGTGKPPSLSKERVAALDDAFAEAAAVPTVVKAVEDSTRMRANRATGWPVTAWFSRLKPDPLKRLHLDLGSSGKELTGAARTSVPKATGVQQARVDTEVRALADQVGDGMAPSWAQAVRAASVSRLPDLGDRLDKAVASTDLGAEKIPAWAGLVKVLQYVLIISALVGAGWLALLAFGSYARLPEPPTPEVLAFPLPTLLLLGGVGLGLLLALVCRWLVALTARSRARKADKRLRDAISAVSQEMVVTPIQAELASYAEVRDGLATALR
ncbi:YfjP family GTPase [Nocardioides baculatus]|uniref:50S ribosome-binding GTPase n=1 Tax=Nocardioides baculatus TaxID=2801337 RepID=A0ABS1L6J2_9ACTN|nr:YfjP family GTPase [Nocardioides baculatus]MBL0747147.1 50S ribosome-binding GTPase [Nocardioides baculatus]